MSKLNALPRGLIYRPEFFSEKTKRLLIEEIAQYRPIWEMRFCDSNPPPNGEPNRRLLRPVYWLGNWQFACLDYYHPPKGIDFRCVRAEPFPSVMQSFVHEAQEMVRQHYDPRDIPKGWELNTCLINYYGSHLEGDRKIDVARVGEHKDFEPGPVVSISFGERALFQFVASKGKQSQSQVVVQQWLDDNSLMIFGGDRFKKQLFHRVQRVEKKSGQIFPCYLDDYETRRLNLTFRYVPRDHIQPLAKFPAPLKKDVQELVTTLGQHSSYWSSES